MFLVFVCFNISLKKRLTSECRVQKAVYPRCDSRRPGKSPKLHTHFCRVDRQKLHEVRGTPARSRQDFLKFHLHLFTVLFKQSNLSSNKHTWRLLHCRIFDPVQLRQREFPPKPRRSPNQAFSRMSRHTDKQTTSPISSRKRGQF